MRKRNSFIHFPGHDGGIRLEAIEAYSMSYQYGTAGQLIGATLTVYLRGSRELTYSGRAEHVCNEYHSLVKALGGRYG